MWGAAQLLAIRRIMTEPGGKPSIALMRTPGIRGLRGTQPCVEAYEKVCVPPYSAKRAARAESTQKREVLRRSLRARARRLLQDERSRVAATWGQAQICASGACTIAGSVHAAMALLRKQCGE